MTDIFIRKKRFRHRHVYMEAGGSSRGLHGKTLHTEWLKHLKLAFSQFWKVKIHDQGAMRDGFC
jgi:hypothetical protein